MAVCYSVDLRQKTIDYILKGNSCEASSKKFDISANTVRSWHKQYLELGHCSPKKRLGKKPRIELSEFEDYVKENSDKTLKEIGEYFKMSAVGALYYIRKIGFVYKKKSLAIEKRVRKEGKTI